MTISTNLQIEYKLEINDIDVTDYISGNWNVAGILARGSARGQLNIVPSYPNTIKLTDEWKFYIKIDSTFVHLLSGVVTNITEAHNEIDKQITLGGYEYLFNITEFTGRFRNDLGTGNKVDIIKAVIDELFTDFTYTDSTIPATTEFFLAQGYQDKNAGKLIEDIAFSLGRDFWIDKDKVVYVKEYVFTQVNEPITYGTNVAAGSKRLLNTEDWANIVKVRGKRVPVPIIEYFSGGGTLNEFILEQFPYAITSVEYTSGTVIDTTFEGATDYESGTLFDAHFKPTVPSLKFNVNTDVGSENIKVVYQVFDQISEELQDAASISYHNNREKVKTIDNENIESQDEAFNIAQNYLERNAYPADIYEIPVVLTTQNQLSNWIIGNRPLVTIDLPDQNIDVSQYLDIVGVRYTLSLTEGVSLSLTLNSVPTKSIDLLKELILRQRQKEDREVASGESITKSFYFGINTYQDIENFSLKEQNADDGSFHVLREDIPYDDRCLIVETNEIPEALSVEAGTTALYALNSGTTEADPLVNVANHGLEGSAEFNGSSDFIRLPASNLLITNANLWTICVTFNADTIPSGSNRAIIYEITRGTTQNTWLALHVTDSNKLRFDYNVTVTLTMDIATISTGTTYTVQISYNGTTIEAIVNNGTPVTQAAAINNTPSTLNANLGSNTEVFEFFDGRIDCLHFWAKTLTTQEKTDIGNGAKYPFTGLSSSLTTDLTASYKLDKIATMTDEYADDPEVVLSVNTDRVYKERFYDDFFIDLDNSSGTLDITTGTYTLGASGTLQSLPVHVENVDFSTAKLGVFVDSGTIASAAVKNENTSFQNITLNTTTAMTAVGDKVVYRVVADASGATINLITLEVEE